MFMSSMAMSAVEPDQRACLEELAETTDSAFVAELIDDFGAEGGRYVAAIQAALTEGDRGSLRIAAHSLKGMSLSLGFFDVGTACLTIEMAARSSNPLYGFDAEIRRIEAGLRESRSIRAWWASEKRL